MTNQGDPSDPRFGEEEKEEGDPFIHSPEHIDDNVRNGLICFLDISRQCGSDCMAYTAYTPEPKTTELGEQSRNCTMLVNIERLGIHLVIAASILAATTKSKKTTEADAVRAAQQPKPPSPMGGQ